MQVHGLDCDPQAHVSMEACPCHPSTDKGWEAEIGSSRLADVLQAIERPHFIRKQNQRRIAAITTSCLEASTSQCSSSMMCPEPWGLIKGVELNIDILSMAGHSVPCSQHFDFCALVREHEAAVVGGIMEGVATGGFPMCRGCAAPGHIKGMLHSLSGL